MYGIDSTTKAERLIDATGIACVVLLLGALYEWVDWGYSFTLRQEAEIKAECVEGNYAQCCKDVFEWHKAGNYSVDLDSDPAIRCPPPKAKLQLAPHALVIALIKLAAIST